MARKRWNKYKYVDGWLVICYMLSLCSLEITGPISESGSVQGATFNLEILSLMLVTSLSAISPTATATETTTATATASDTAINSSDAGLQEIAQMERSLQKSPSGEAEQRTRQGLLLRYFRLAGMLEEFGDLADTSHG